MYKSEQLKPYGSEGSKREQVEAMFDNIAPTYDALNHTLSLGVDRLWRRTAIEWLGKQARREGVRPLSILDIATGTGDFAIEAWQRLKPERIVGIDISEGMMAIGREKVERMGLGGRIDFRSEDCAAMSLGDGTFDAVISAFALRNFQHLERCFGEMHRVLADGGRMSIIDLCVPVSFPMRQLYWLYSRTAMPLVGRLMSKDGNAYTYLPESMRAVPQGQDMCDIIAGAGFRNVQYRRLVFGMCIHYTAEK